MFEALNDWFVKYPNILILSVPLISALVGWMTALYAARRVYRSNSERMRFDSLVKISEIRQEWISSLRDSMAEFQSHGITPGHNPKNELEFYRLGTKIELLMNPDDEDYKELQNVMYKFLEASEGDINIKYQINAKYVAVCQKILEREKGKLNEDLKVGIV